ncbi:PREDICTED: protein angel homolog 2-like [Papilio polytes]|uniref:protein angel homolog 2-like n=1 Tax=Papilio polytes TaxID=76194 RepID=UPI000676006C|nr:PREDICTED: protein angel homolog 2-like [Papilio polytes]
MEGIQKEQVPLNIEKKKSKRKFRTWERIGKWDIRDIQKSFTFKVVSYNILSQHLLESQLYLFQNCSMVNLQWDVRSKRLFDQIIRLDPDILCLQEVHASYRESFFSQFEEVGYTGVFKKRTGVYDDGCAIYFKKSVFQMEDHILVQFCQTSYGILNRDEVGLAVRLVPLDARAPSSPLVVATTRLFHYVGSEHVRLAQLQLFLAHLERFANNGCQLGYHPIILSGDINSAHETPVIKFLTRGHVSVSKTRLRGVEIQNINQDQPPELEGPANPWDESLPFVSELEHPLSLRSVYEHRKKNGRREVTTFYRTNWNNFDYIFYSRDSRLRLLARYRLPTDAECRQLIRPYSIPNRKLPSNHFSLAAIFQYGSPMAN